MLPQPRGPLSIHNYYKQAARYLEAAHPPECCVFGLVRLDFRLRTQRSAVQPVVQSSHICWFRQLLGIKVHDWTRSCSSVDLLLCANEGKSCQACRTRFCVKHNGVITGVASVSSLNRRQSFTAEGHWTPPRPHPGHGREDYARVNRFKSVHFDPFIFGPRQ